MSKKFTRILGVDIPLDTLASVTSTPPTSYSTYIMGASSIFFDSTLMESLKASLEETPFSAIAQRRSTAIPCKAGVSRQFFQYDGPFEGQV